MNFSKLVSELMASAFLIAVLVGVVILVFSNKGWKEAPTYVPIKYFLYKGHICELGDLVQCGYRLSQCDNKLEYACVNEVQVVR